MTVLITQEKDKELGFFTAKTDEYFYDGDGYCTFTIAGYGDTKTDAVAQLKGSAKAMIKNLQALIDNEAIGV